MLGTKLMRGALAVVLTCVGLMSLFVESASAQADTPIGEWVRIPGSSGWDRLRIQGYGSTITAVDSYSPIPPPEGVWDPFYFRVANNGDVLLSRYADNKLEYGDPLTYVVSLMSNGQLSVILTDPYEMWVYTPASTSQEQTTTTTALQPQISASGEYYNLILRYSKNCLGVQGGQATEVTCDANSQVWNLPTTPTDYFQIQMQDSNQCLSASSNTETEPFALKSCDGSADQQWQEIPSGGLFPTQKRNHTRTRPD